MNPAWTTMRAAVFGVAFCVLGGTGGTAAAEATGAAARTSDSRPNILWITSEDNGPHLGCYGDAYADTPNLDALAARSILYRNAWSNAPVCAPARTAIISGMYPPSTGSEHMRSMTRLPDGFLMFPRYLRDAGYYCTNNSKEDYNLEKAGTVWDESSPRAHWRHRAKGQPFFAVFNHTVTHESQIRRRPHTPIHDPAKVRVPPYHPDTPEVRLDWAQYYDKITEMDALVGANLRELAEAGLEEDTIVVYFGDHGSGMPRNKRWPLDCGLHVPLIVRLPAKFASLGPDGQVQGSGTVSERLVSFVDLAPTMLSLAGVKPPRHLQGRAFLGPHRAPPSRYLFGFRGRMDERIDLVRSVRDERYVYVRHFMPHLPYGQHLAYMFQTPTTQVWKSLYDAGRLNPVQSRFWEPKPVEELYDLRTDPDEIQDLAEQPEYREVVERMRGVLRDWQREIRDVGMLPEDELHVRSVDRSPYDVGHDASFPFDRILETAEIASAGRADSRAVLVERLEDPDSAVRYWSVLGLVMRGAKAIASARGPLERRLDDACPSVRVAAAEAFTMLEDEGDRRRGLDRLVAHADLNGNSLYVVVAALNALDRQGSKTSVAADAIRRLPRTSESIPARMREYSERLLERIDAHPGPPGDGQ